MTTITLEKDIDLGRTVFKDVRDFLDTFYKQVDFSEISKEDLSQDLLNKVNLSKKKDISIFNNI